MARETIAGLKGEVENLKERLANARTRDYDECSIGDLSTALLTRLDTLKMEKRDEIDESEVEFDKIDTAYSEADSADDRIRELDL